MNYFDGLPLVLGSVRGKRIWELDEDGLLVSPVMEYRWDMDEQEATCSAEPDTVMFTILQRYLHAYVVPEFNGDAKGYFSAEIYEDEGKIGVSWSMPMDKAAALEDHPYLFQGAWRKYPSDDVMLKFDADSRTRSVQGEFTLDFDQFLPYYSQELEAGTHMENCTCGFYAFFADSPHEYQGHVVGVVEGYGETLVGTKGFRCEKTRIIALAPTGDTTSFAYNHKRILESLQKNHSEVPTFRSENEMYAAFPLTSAQEVHA